MKAENCIILLNTTAYVVSRVHTVNCNEADGYTIPMNIWMGYSYSTTKQILALGHHHGECLVKKNPYHL